MILQRIRWNEYKVLAYRLCLAYFFYAVARLLFYLFNAHLIAVDTMGTFLKLCYYGLAFDTTAILYINLLFIVLSLVPLQINTSATYQRILFYIYILFNGIAYATNFIDFIYYPYNFGRSTIAVTDSILHEEQAGSLLFSFLLRYWYVAVLFFLCMCLWIYLYKRVRIKPVVVHSKKSYYITSFIGLAVAITLCVGGIRGDFKNSTRPINMIDAGRHVHQLNHADIVLNTPFAVIRTLFKNSFKEVHLVERSVIDSLLVPIKHYAHRSLDKRNIVIFILESNAKEYYGCLNEETHIPHFQGYTPFMDSLSKHSLLFTNAYANGYKSIHAVSSVVAGIPSFRDAFTSSPYAIQPTESLISTLKSIGYSTSFFHGAPNGSMGFLGYVNMLGVDRYYGKTEYHNDDDFDGSWGIWDEPFFQYFAKTLSHEKEPFFSTLFSLTSHEPYHIPDQYKGKFPKGTVNIHETIGYTDYALKQFFATASKEAWFKNTLFVFVGDHGNTIYYDEYKKEMNKNTVMMMIYDPKGTYVGVRKEVSQQIDIYPTMLDIVGYDRPFRSWGRSLVRSDRVMPFMMRYSSGTYQLQSGDYICVMDGTNAIGFYDKQDKNLVHNLIQKRTPAMDTLEWRCKAFVQDYMDRIIHHKLATH